MFRTQFFIKSMCILIISLTLQDQWWCCGFNPEYIGNVDVHRQVMVGKIDFSGKPELFKDFNIEYQYQIDRGIEFQWEQLIVDTDNEIVWIMWGA